MRETIKIINIKDKYRKVRGKTNWNENKKILSINTTRHDVFLYLNKNKLNSKMKLTLIHELLHARGYNHGYIQKLKFSSHSYNDQVSKAVLKGIMILEKGKTIREIKINVNGPDKRTFIVIKRLQKYMRIKTEIEEFFYYFPF